MSTMTRGGRRAIRVMLLLTTLVAAAAARADVESAQRSHQAIATLKQYLQSPATGRGELAQQPFATTPLEKEDAVAARQLLWDDHVVRIRRDRAAEVQARKLVDGQLEMPFAYTVFGEKPTGGRSLFISMHGGGGTAKAVNDQQWENQKRLYKPVEGVYLAPRAPTDHWNLWHEAHIDRLFARLIEDLIVFEDVNPDRVYLMGYSAGGDGVYQLAPRMADRFAAASMMAGHPNDASPLGLRNLPFAIHVGANDGGFKRNQVAAEWGKKLDDLAAADPGGYVHVAKLHANKGHWMDREDAEAIPWMTQYTRDATPKKVVWRQASVTHDQFYWLATPDPKKGAEVTATVEGQHITIQSKAADPLLVRLSDRLLDLDKSVTLTVNDTKQFEGLVPRTIATLSTTLNERGDPGLTFDAELPTRR